MTFRDVADRETISIPEAAQICGVSRGVAYAAAHDGTLPVLRLGHRLLVPVAALRRLLEDGSRDPR